MLLMKQFGRTQGPATRAGAANVRQNDDLQATLSQLHLRITPFSYDPEHGSIFETWYGRYQDGLQTDGSALDDRGKARVIVQKLDYQACDRFSAHILPEKTAELTLNEALTTLTELFGHNMSLITRRYNYLKVQCENDSQQTFSDYTAKVNRLHELAEMSTITPD